MAVDNSSWDGAAAMSEAASSDDPAAAYAAICAGRREGDPALQSSWALPHHREPGMGPNADGVRNSMSRLPQTQGLTNARAAEAHLAAHMDEIHAAMRSEDTESIEVRDVEVEVRDATRREVDVRVVPWDVPIDTAQGREVFARGAFAGTAPDGVLLMGLEHEAHIGLGQDGRPVLTRRPLGRSIAMSDEADGQHATFRVAKTSAGDEFLALAADRVVTGVSLEFTEIPGGTVTQNRDGRRTRVHQRVAWSALSPTYRPAYREAQVLAVRSEGEAPMADQEAPVAGAAPEPQVIDLSPLQNRVDTAFARVEEHLAARLDKLEEQARSRIELPAPTPEKPLTTRGEWVDIALKILSGERIPDSQYRAVADVISTDNAGLIPNAYMTELIGVIDPVRPFMTTTRRIPTPASGMSLVVPVITQRPTVGEQSPEKEELSSQETKISTKTFDMVTKGGVGDISLQLLKRADRSFLDLYLQLLAEAYAIECDVEATRALLDAAGGVGAGTALDPNDLALGDAYVAAYDAIKRPPDTIWLSTDAVGAFIDAKEDTTNRPLYSNITANITAGGGVAGTIQGLRAVHVPALDAHGAFAIVGPSNGFAWAEDGTYTLQVDVPSKAGRDVALVGMLWFAPWYPDAFSIFNVAS